METATLIHLLQWKLFSGANARLVFDWKFTFPLIEAEYGSLEDELSFPRGHFALPG